MVRGSRRNIFDLTPGPLPSEGRGEKTLVPLPRTGEGLGEGSRLPPVPAVVAEALDPGREPVELQPPGDGLGLEPRLVSAVNLHPAEERRLVEHDVVEVDPLRRERPGRERAGVRIREWLRRERRQLP